jgi:hypothetical protein
VSAPRIAGPRAMEPTVIINISITIRTDETFLVYSPFHGIRQLVGLPAEDNIPHSIAVWDGYEITYLPTHTLMPLSFDSAVLLSVRS